MPVEKIVRNRVIEAAKEIENGSQITVAYDSARSDENKSMSGTVTRVNSKANGQIGIVFRRPDGQYCTALSDGWLYSHGSHFPRDGEITDIEIE